MEGKHVSLYIAMSLDGYIADESGSVAWFDQVDQDGDMGYAAFFENIDTVVMGKKTYQQIFSLTDAFPYADKAVYVFSSKQANTEDEHAKFVKGSSEDWLDSIESEKIWLVGGADLIKQFLKEKVIDEYVITVAPILLGKGIPLFDVASSIGLTLKAVSQFGQFAQLTYHNQEEAK